MSSTFVTVQPPSENFQPHLVQSTYGKIAHGNGALAASCDIQAAAAGGSLA